jgi:hypothetical protein
MADFIDIFDLYNNLLSNVNSQQGGHVRPQVDFENFLNQVNSELYREKLKEWEKSQIITDELKPFLKSVSVIITPLSAESYDLVPYPPEYENFSSARIFLSKETGTGCLCDKLDVVDNGTCKQWEDPDVVALRNKNVGGTMQEIPIAKVDNQRWGAATSHAFRKPANDRPIMTQYESGFKIAPKNLGIIRLDYFRAPKNVKFGYTTSPSDQILYDANTSIQLEWSPTMRSEILARLEKKYFKPVREWEGYTASEQERQIAK